ncbi:MAG: LTA synthase family protein [Peptostreptococcales bacterium]
MFNTIFEIIKKFIISKFKSIGKVLLKVFYYIRKFVQGEIENFKGIFNKKSNFSLIAAIVVFIMLNILKITFFNFYLMPERSFELLKYKFYFTLFALVVLYPFLFVFKSRIFLIGFYITQTIYMLVNTGYYMYFQRYFHIKEVMSIMSEGLIAIRNFSAPFNPVLLLLLIDAPVLFFIVKRYYKCPELIKRVRFVVLILLILCPKAAYAMEKENFTQKVSFRQNVKNYYEGEAAIVERYGTLFNSAINMYNSRDYSFLANNFVYGKEIENKHKASKKNPNFIFIQVESMDANTIYQTHNGEYIAPFLNELSNNSVYYPNTMSYHLGGSTSDTEFSVMNSIEPLSDYPSIKLSNYDYANSFLKQLKASAYSTVAFHGNVGGFFNRNLAFPKMGFDALFDIDAMGLKNQGWGAADHEVFEYALEKIKQLEQPFFAYTITMTSHGPFTNANNYYNNPAFDDIGTKRVRNYYNSINYVDQTLENFVNQVNEHFDNTYIIIMGDHTPAVKSGPYQQASYTEDSRYFEFVPLFIITPDKKVYKETEVVASFLDLSPTILNAAKINYKIKSDGLDLLKYPIENNEIPFVGGFFERKTLFDNVPEHKTVVQEDEDEEENMEDVNPSDFKSGQEIE